MAAKYIVIDVCPVSAIVFSGFLTHGDVAMKFHGEVLGAGFCHVQDDGYFSCYGESVSLNIKSRGEQDARILNQQIAGVQP